MTESETTFRAAAAGGGGSAEMLAGPWPGNGRAMAGRAGDDQSVVNQSRYLPACRAVSCSLRRSRPVVAQSIY